MPADHGPQLVALPPDPGASFGPAAERSPRRCPVAVPVRPGGASPRPSWPGPVALRRRLHDCNLLRKYFGPTRRRDGTEHLHALASVVVEPVIAPRGMQRARPGPTSMVCRRRSRSAHLRCHRWSLRSDRGCGPGPPADVRWDRELKTATLPLASSPVIRKRTASARDEWSSVLTRRLPVSDLISASIRRLGLLRDCLKVL
jgi:hypothetical protein